jgi:hypothetical protein
LFRHENQIRTFCLILYDEANLSCSFWKWSEADSKDLNFGQICWMRSLRISVQSRL